MTEGAGGPGAGGAGEASSQRASGRASPWDLAGLFVLSAGLRFAYVLSVAGHPAVRYPMVDGRSYHEKALAILGGDWLGDRIFFQDPLYPYFLAALYAVFGPKRISLL